MPPIESTYPRNYDFFNNLPEEEQRLRMESWRSFERCIEDGSYQRSSLRALAEDRRRHGPTVINTSIPEPMVLPSLEKKIPPPPPCNLPTAYERRTKVVPIEDGLFLEIVPRSPTNIDLFFLNDLDDRVRIPPHIELINSADLRPVISSAIQPNMPYSMWSIEKSERYALLNLNTGQFIHHLRFRWEIRRLD